MSETKIPPFKFVVEYVTEDGKATARFTNEKHAKAFIRNLKRDNVKKFVLKEIKSKK